MGIGSQTSWINYLIPVSNGVNSRLYFTSTKKKGLLYILADNIVTQVNNQQNDRINFSIFPNPAKEKAIVIYKGTDELKDVKVEIRNMLGETVLKQSLTDVKSSFDITQFANGVYFITLYQNNYSTTQKLIIQ